MTVSLAPVVAAVIELEGRYLLARRAPHKADAGWWEFPGGQIEAGESPAGALARELLEELNVQASVGRLLHQTVERGRHFQAFAVTIVGRPRLHDHDELQWVPPGGFCNYRMHPFDRAVADLL